MKKTVCDKCGKDLKGASFSINIKVEEAEQIGSIQIINADMLSECFTGDLCIDCAAEVIKFIKENKHV